jgi:sugar porter (SP) family MFS transporter
MIYFLAAVAAIAGLLFGFDEGVIAVAAPSLAKDYPMSSIEEGVMTAAVPFGALCACLLAGRLTHRFGRRPVLMGAAVLFAIGALAAALTQAVWMLVLARMDLGLAIGAAAIVAPLYISESAPERIRGALVATYQLAITLGILGAYLTGLALNGPGMWRWMFALGTVPALLFLAGLFFLPESPHWLMLAGREGEARASLIWLHGKRADIEPELAAIRAAAANGAGAGGLGEVFRAAPVRPVLIVAMGLFFLQQLSGINAVIYYAPQIFSAAGFADAQTAILATVGIGMVNFLTTFAGMWLVDGWGRRPLLVTGFVGTSICLTLIAASVLLPGGLPHWLVLAALFGYIAAFAMSLGPLPHIMMSEVFPLRLRGAGMGAASLSNWGFNVVVVFSFPLLLRHLGLGGVFLLFAVMCAAGVVFTLSRVPETKGLSLEAIQNKLGT